MTKKENLELNLGGILTKHASAESNGAIIIKVDVKCTDSGDIVRLIRSLDRYGVENLASAIPAVDVPCSKYIVPMSEYGLFFVVCIDPDEMKEGYEFAAKLETITVTSKNHVPDSLTLSFIKPPEVVDAGTQVNYLKHKEVIQGKRQLKVYGMRLQQIEPFFIGNELQSPDEDEDDVTDCVDGIEVHRS